MPHPSLEPADAPRRGRRRSRWSIVIAALLGLLLLLGGGAFADWWLCLPEDVAATYVGRQTCVECHTPETHLWQGSHHDLAMDRATEQTVLGDFAEAELLHFGITSRMFRRDGKFFVNTEGPDGALADFEIKYVFGVDPLQQYMVEFDRPPGMPANEIARLQVLRISWDTREKRWFYLSPTDVKEKLRPDDVLHWTGIAQCWNTMCAECHSTNLQKKYDHVHKIYHTTFSEIDVSCEACHGPGSVHLELARSKSLFWDRKHGYGLAKLKGDNNENQIQMCAHCHSRRSVAHPGFQAGEPFYDYFSNELLETATYHPDGQIKDEVYVYGSFLQSKMYHKGIRCTDCHDPHSVRLIHEGNTVCTSCHTHTPEKYDGPRHHHHKTDSTGASCVECHMPETTYMDVDPRRDHSLRIPRPDLSVELGTPNACTRCHLEPERLPLEKREGLRQYADWLVAARTDPQIADELARVDAWALENVKKWYGDETSDSPHFARVLASARNGERESLPVLRELALNRRTPNIIRATAALELGRFPDRTTRETLLELLSDKDPQIRVAALRNLQGNLTARQLMKYVLPLTKDPLRLVRTEAARVSAELPDTRLTGEQRAWRNRALQEFEAGVMENSERAGAHAALGVLYEARGDDQAAEQAYRRAIHVEPSVSGPRANLAALYERRIEAAQGNLRSLAQDRKALEAAALRIQADRQRVDELRRQELDLLRRDAALAPEIAGVQYRYGMACYLAREMEEAKKALIRAYELEPNTVQFVLALALFHERLNRVSEALRYARELVKLQPDDPSYQQILQQIERKQQETLIGPAPPPRSKS